MALTSSGAAYVLTQPAGISLTANAVADEIGRVRPTMRVADTRRGVVIFLARIVKNLSGEIAQ